MLKPLRKKTEVNEEVPYGSDSPQVECENCGKNGPSHLMINCMFVVGSPGHPSLEPFQCEHLEHWSCSIECWNKVAHACIDEHMTEMLKQKHESLVH